MKLEINLDKDWVDEYCDTLGEKIEAEIERCIKAEVNRAISAAVKQHVDKLRDRLAEMMRNIPSKKLDDYLARISREGM